MEFWSGDARLKIICIRFQMVQNKGLRIIEGWQMKQKLEPVFIKFEILLLINY